LALRRGSWSEALEQIDEELQAGGADAVRRKLDKVKVLCALHRRKEASSLVQDLAREPDLGQLRGLVILWKVDLALADSPLKDSSAELEQALAAGLQGPELLYAQALLAPTTTRLVAALEGAREESQLAQRASALLGMTYLLLGEESKARERIAFGEVFFPADPAFRVLRMLLETRAGNSAEAAKAVKWLEDREHKGAVSKQALAAALAFRGMLRQFISMEAALAGKSASFGPIVTIALMDTAKEFWGRLADGRGALLPLPPLYLKIWTVERLGKLLVAQMGIAQQRNLEALNKELIPMTAAHPDAYLYFCQGLVFDRLGRSADAEKAFVKATTEKSFLRIQRAAENAAIGCRVIQALDAPGGNPKLVAQTLQQLRTLIAPGNVSPDLAEGLALFALKANEPDLARLVVQSWERLAPKDKTVTVLRAKVELGAGAYGRVLEIAREFTKADPQYNAIVPLREQAREAILKQAESLRKAP
jgi:hypothetical protein